MIQRNNVLNLVVKNDLKGIYGYAWEKGRIFIGRLITNYKN